MPRWILQTVFTDMRMLLFTKEEQFILEADKIEMSPRLQKAWEHISGRKKPEM